MTQLFVSSRSKTEHYIFASSQTIDFQGRHCCRRFKRDQNGALIKRVRFSRQIALIPNSDVISDMEIQQMWWQQDDYNSFKAETAMQLRAVRATLSTRFDEVVLLAEKFSRSLIKEEDVESVLENLQACDGIYQWFCGDNSYRGLEHFARRKSESSSKTRANNLTKITVLSYRLASDELRQIAERHSRFHRILARMIGAADAKVMATALFNERE